MDKNPIKSRMKAMQFDKVLLPHFSILPFPRFSQRIRVGSGAAATVGHFPAIYL